MKKTKKLNNKGVTLVELLIGVGILGIIIGPFLGAFMMSTRTNTRAKQMGMATTAAENVMEKIRGLKLQEEIVERLGEHQDDALSAVFADSKPVMISTDTSAALYEWSDKKGTVVYKGTSTSVGAIKFIDKSEVNGHMYIAEITMDPRFDSKDPEGNVTTASAIDEYTDYNNEEYTSIYSMNGKMDCSFLQTSNMDNAALELFSVYDREDVKNHMTRKIVVTIGDADPKDVSVQIEYTYNSMVKRLFPDAKHISGKITDKVRNIFVYYTPYTPDDKYIGVSGGETIEIVNKNHVEGVTVYIVCQNSEKQGNKIDYNTYKSNSPTISLIEGETTDTFDGTVYTKIRVGDSLFVDNAANPIADVFQYKMNTKDVIGSSNTSAKDAIGISKLAAEGKADRAYDVTISVYPIEDYKLEFYEDFINNEEKDFSSEHNSALVDKITGAKERQ